MSVIETTREIQDQVVEAVEATQDAVVEGVRNFTDRSGGPLVDLSSVPGIEEVPTAREVVDNIFDFTTKVVETTRRFVTGLVDATAPLVRCGNEGEVGTTQDAG